MVIISSPFYVHYTWRHLHHIVCTRLALASQRTEVSDDYTLASASPRGSDLSRSRLIKVGTADQVAAKPPKTKPRTKKKKGFWDNDDDINTITESAASCLLRKPCGAHKRMSSDTSYDLIKLDYAFDYLSEHEIEPYPAERLSDLNWPGEVPFVEEEITSYCACMQNKRILIAGDSLLRGVYSAAVEFLRNDRHYCDDSSTPKAERSKCSGDGKYWHDVRSDEAIGKDRRRCEKVMKNEGSPCYSGRVDGLCGGVEGTD